MSDIIIYGRGKTGKSLYNLLQRQGKTADFYDDIVGFSGVNGFSSQSIVILSPGVKPTSSGIAEAKKVGAKIVGELEYCFPLCKSKVISVTGTNGKTTTCEMIYHCLKTVGRSCRLLGNGGTPLSSQVLDIDKQELVVLESSSFQLMNSNSFSPFVSIFTSLACDHLDYHGSYENYAQAKTNNFIHQEANAFAIFNADDENVRELSVSCPCQKLFYSLGDKTANVYYDNGSIVINIANHQSVVEAQFLSTYAKHNISNALAAALACHLVGASVFEVMNALKNYSFLPHRLQSVANFNGIEFIDDSKATNVHATVNAVRNFSCNLALILGGSSKGDSFDVLFSQLKKNVVIVAAVGQTADEIFAEAYKYGVDVIILDDIGTAARYCYERLASLGGGVVLMSNACASFDKFSGYAERGDYFQKAVREIMCGEETD